MKKRSPFLITCLFLLVMESGCGYLRIDPNHYLIRSDVIDSAEKEAEILSRAKLGWTEDGAIRVLHISGTPYERGYQQGVLLRKEIQDNIGTLYENAVDTFHFEELFAEAFERERPFIPQEYIDEMHGLAHGSRLPLHVIHGVHILPEITEWGGKKRLKKIAKAMMDGTLGTSCSNFSASSGATQDGEMYTLRILDWGLHKISKLHQYPLITVIEPDKGVPSVNIGWVGFLGAISGMNAEGITLGEMGYGDPEHEWLRGKPMPFVLRDVLTYSKNLADVRRIIKESPGTSSFVFLMSDGKNKEAELYIKDRHRFEVHKPGQTLADGEKSFPGIQSVVYGGHFDEKMTSLLSNSRGSITPQMIMQQFVPEMAMKSNFQNVLYEPAGLKFWVNNAKSSSERAAEQPFTYFDFGKAIGKAR